MSIFTNVTPFENRYKMMRILNYGKPYTNYTTYNIKDHPNNNTNILAIYIDNTTCTNIPTNKALVNETTSLLSTKLLNKYFVEIHYTSEENKPILEYIMTEYDINELLSKYDFGIKL